MSEIEKAKQAVLTARAKIEQLDDAIMLEIEYYLKFIETPIWEGLALLGSKFFDDYGGRSTLEKHRDAAWKEYRQALGNLNKVKREAVKKKLAIWKERV